MSIGRAGIEAGRAFLSLSIRDQTRRDLGGIENRLRALGSRFSELGRTLFLPGIVGTGLFAAIFREGAAAEQQLGRIAGVFRGLAPEAVRFSDQLAAGINQSVVQIREQLTTLQAFLQGVGIDPQAAFTLAKEFTQLSQDIIAFADDTITAEHALTILRSGLSGEVRAIRQLGPDVRVLALEQELLRQELELTAKTASESQRVLARANLIRQGLARSGITGQALREVNTLAAQFRGLSGAVQVAARAIGTELGPVFLPFVNGLRAVVDATIQFSGVQGELLRRIAVSVGVITGLGVSFLTLGLSIKALALSLGLLTGLFGILKGIAVIAAGVLLLKTAFDLTAGAFVGFADRFTEFRTAIGGGISGVFTSVKGQLSAFVSGIERTLSGITDLLTVGNVKAAAELAAAEISLAFKKTQADLTAIFASVRVRLIDVFSGIAVFANSVAVEIKSVFAENIAAVGEFFAEEFRFDPKGLTKNLEGILSRFRAFASSFRDIWRSATDFFEDAFDIVATSIQAVFGRIIEQSLLPAIDRLIQISQVLDKLIPTQAGKLITGVGGILSGLQEVRRQLAPAALSEGAIEDIGRASLDAITRREKDRAARRAQADQQAANASDAFAQAVRKSAEAAKLADELAKQERAGEVDAARARADAARIAADAAAEDADAIRKRFATAFGEAAPAPDIAGVKSNLDSIGTFESRFAPFILGQGESLLDVSKKQLREDIKANRLFEEVLDELKKPNGLVFLG